MRLGNYLTSIITFILFLSPVCAQNKYNSYYDSLVIAYINKWAPLAIQEMKRTGIPASIKLAQAIVESGAGTSWLARTANNHFGIKCHNWEGPRVYKDDDAPNECFRKYKTPEESFIDHSRFLTTRPRYSFLFELDPLDYKAWAYGLKKAGYATNPRYAQKLIEVIEKYNLARFDTMALQPAGENKSCLRDTVVNLVKAVYVMQDCKVDINQISQLYSISPKNLYKWNEHLPDSIFQSVRIVYLQPKRRHSVKYRTFRIKTPLSLAHVSQMTGVKLYWLRKYNPHVRNPFAVLDTGTVIYLRKKHGSLNSSTQPQHTDQEIDWEYISAVPCRYIQHRVEPGETISSIASKYGIPARWIELANDIKEDQPLTPGMILQIPVPQNEKGVNSYENLNPFPY